MSLKRSALLFCLLWIVLWGVSTAYRASYAFERAPESDLQRTRVLLDLESAPVEAVELAYRERNSDAAGRPILILHGNPMASVAMRPLADALGTESRLLIPDLPGMGSSDPVGQSFSAASQVTVLLAWLEQLEVDSVHVVGYSQGGAAALELAALAPDLVESVSMVAAVGLQEHELLGRYEWNQPIYRVYYGLLWSARWFVPHFGLLDTPTFSPNTALNFAHTDLRRNRAFIEALRQPTLILHSASDRLVPYSAAQAHAELLPEAFFQALPGGHMGLFYHTEAYAAALRSFLRRVEAGNAQAIAEERAPALALAATQSSGFMRDVIIAGLLFLLVFFSEDLSCIAGGILAASGTVSFSAAVLGCFLGIFLSDVGLYVIGRVLGANALKIGFIARAAEGGAYERFQRGYEASGFKIVFLTRFIPGSRVIAYVTAGVLRVKAPRFSLWLGISAVVWTPILVSIAYFVGRPLIHWWEQSGWVVLPLILGALLLSYFIFHLLIQSLTYRGRCKLRGRWLRWTRWEYWPALPVYLPVVLYGCYLAVKFRGTTLWAMCNPGMAPLSGLALESKSEILDALNHQTGAIADWCCIATSVSLPERIEALNAFLEEEGLDWPIVLKPDVGQRGEGVAIIRTAEQAERYLAENAEPVIAQRYIPGAEFGVFYIRYPGESKGRIFSITEKVLPKLVGDGERTVERLILDDARAVAQAKYYLQVNAGRLHEVPEVGQSIRLVELGTHCRGAIFLDGNRYASDALGASLDAVFGPYRGFYFGRCDLRVPSGEDLQAGRGFKILELNGVSSESTDIYDPKNSIFDGWAKLCRQWRIAFEIGAANREAGAPVPSWRAIWQVARGHRVRQPYEAVVSSAD